jgi:hypothetical protein
LHSIASGTCPHAPGRHHFIRSCLLQSLVKSCILSLFCCNITASNSTRLRKLWTGIVAGMLVLLSNIAFAQVRVSGKVYDITQKNPLEAVSVISTSGGGTVSDVNGRYTIIVHERDSIWFSYLGKPTPKFPVATIVNVQNFEVALHVNVSDLKRVVVMPPSYKRDSIQNRIDYAKAFNFKRPNLESLTSMSPSGGVGLDINEFIRLFQFRRNRRMEAFQERLLREEMEKFIDHRFSRALIIRITQLRGPDLDTFIRWYRPTVEFTETATDYEFQSYIKRCYFSYRRFKLMTGEPKKEEDLF